MSRDQWLWMRASVSLIAAAARAMRQAVLPPPARETSWRDLVRRLARNPVKAR